MQREPWQTRAIAHVAKTSEMWRFRRTVGALLAAALCAGGATAALAQDGKALFQTRCAVCHNVGGGPKVGPDLKDAIAKRGKEGVVAVVLDPAKAGLKPTMPNLGLPRAEVEAIAAFVEKEAAGGPTAERVAPPAPAASPAEPQPDEIRMGEDLFEGKLRFAKGGPSCNACHHVTSETAIGGGVLAAELSLVFSRMGKQGVQSILENSPFPVMQAAYQGKDLSEKEIGALVAFLQHVEKEHARQLPKEYGWRMASAGAGGVIVLLGIFSLAGRRRKNRCVNQDIYDRQVKSE